MKVTLDKNAFMPTSAHAQDAGYDLYAPETVVIPPHSYATVDVGVHMEIPTGYVGFIKSKSGLNVKYNILCEGVIDSGYTGSIVVKAYNHGNAEKTIKRGEKITQIVFLPIFKPELELVNTLEKTDRGDNGFGSSGR